MKKYKYDASILCIFKNEEFFLSEWIQHYLNRNIDHIYLINDNSSDSSLDIVNDSSYKKYITLKHTDKEDSCDKEHWRQERIYNKHMKECIQETKWIGVFDADEFCYSPETTNLKDILKYYDTVYLQELIIDWYWFGSNNFIDQPKQIVKSFLYRSNLLAKDLVKNLNISSMGYHHEWCCKSFAKTRLISSIRNHYNRFLTKNKTGSLNRKSQIVSKNLSNNSVMFINHYLGAKNYYFNNKVARGSCNNNQAIAKNKEIIYDHINVNEIKDTRLRDQNDEIQRNTNILH